jgi:hypothetical protein
MNFILLRSWLNDRQPKRHLFCQLQKPSSQWLCFLYENSWPLWNIFCVEGGICVWWKRGGADGWGTALQAGRSRVRFPTGSLWPCGQLNRCIGLTTLVPSCAECLEILGASTSWIPKDLCRDCFTFFCFLVSFLGGKRGHVREKKMYYSRTLNAISLNLICVWPCIIIVGKVILNTN